MKRDELTNLPASVRHKLLNLSKANGEEFGLMLSRFAIERLLYRLSISPHREVFLLKGAALFALWPDLPRRRTRDVDFLGTGEATPERLAEIFRALCQIETVDDGLHFRPESVRVAPIREEQRYGGQRVRLEATLSGARIALQIDVGFGDAVTPAPREADYPTLLAFPAPHLKHYAPETVIAEKWQAIVDLGMGNTRLKDFYDLWLLAKHMEFEGAVLATSLRATFERRQTALPETVPEALTSVFTRDAAKVAQWSAFTRKSQLINTPDLPEIAAFLQTFLWPVTQAARIQRTFTSLWKPASGWHKVEPKTPRTSSKP